MKTHLDIDALVHSMGHRTKGVRDPQIMHPARDWFFGIGISVALTICGVWFSVHLYHSFQTATNTIAPNVVPPVAYKAINVDAASSNIRQQYDDFAKRFGVWNLVPVDALHDVMGTTTTELPIFDSVDDSAYMNSEEEGGLEVLPVEEPVIQIRSE